MNRRKPPEDQVVSTDRGDVVLTYSRGRGSCGTRVITARMADHGDDIGYLSWNVASGKISMVRVDPSWMRRLGIATAMYEMAKTAPGRGPYHNSDRTRLGDLWARAAGGRLPRLWD